MKKMFFLIIVIVGFCKCSKNKNDCCATIDSYIDIVQINSQGLNLVSENILKEESIKTYHVVQGESIEYFEPNLDAPRGVLLVEEGEDSYVRLFPNDVIEEDNTSVTIIDWGINELKRDTILSEYSLSNSFLSKLTLNGELVWDSTIDEGRRVIEIIR